jgi:hypothetical protein
MSDLTNDTPWEPPFSGTEAEHLLGALDRLRWTFRWKADGLDAGGLATRLGPSTLTLGGLLKHLAAVEQRYAIDFSGEPPGPPLDRPESRTDPDWVWRSAAGDTPEELYALWRGAVARSRAAMAGALAAGGLDQPARFTRSDEGESPNPRRILVDLHDEYARHVGHADLLREAVDGLVGEDPPQPA